MESKKKNKKIYIEETIGSRKYFSYRADLLLYKLILCVVIYLIIYSITSELLISIVVSVQVLLIFTLINKLIIERKESEGRELLLKKFKKNYFSKKINEMNMVEFEKFTNYYFETKGYSNFKKVGKHLYLINKFEDNFYVKIYKFYEGAEIEKTDIRNLISILNNNSIKNIIIVTTNKLSDDADNIIKKFNSDLNIQIISTGELYEFADINKYLPDDKFFYKQIQDSKSIKNVKKHKVLKNNIFDTKKIIIYFIASVLFYIMSKIMSNNIMTLYVSYYFITLSIISVIYFIILKTIRIKVKE
jgi:hypothetical protein